MSPSNPPGPGPASSGPSRVPIPKATHKPPDQNRKPGVPRPYRAARACLTCKSRKVRCNSALPKCSNCVEHATSCVYPTIRKDRLRVATSRNQEMITLLRDLLPQVPESEQTRIHHLLKAATDDVDDATTAMQKAAERQGQSPYSEEQGEAKVSADVGNNSDLDLLDEDINYNETARATGFVGKASEVQWLRRVDAQKNPNQPEGPYGPPGEDVKSVSDRLSALRHRQKKDPWPVMHTSKASFYLDDEPFNTDLTADPLVMPPYETAEKLLHTYMESCHNSYPLLAKRPFMDQFYRYYVSLGSDVPYTPSKKWQAALNLVFAIGSVYNDLTRADCKVYENHHCIYYSRAWILSLDDPWWFSHPDLPQMQITSLLAFYYLSIGHVNRSWVLIGTALRSGIAMGLHIRNEDSNIDVVKKENMSRIWWGNYCLELLVSAITGRPCIEMEGISSVPLPLPTSSEDIEKSVIETQFRDSRDAVIMPKDFLRGQEAGSGSKESTVKRYPASAHGPANSGSYLKHTVRLSLITRKSLSLYAAGTVNQSWQSVQTTIASLIDELDAWAASLPEGLQFLNRTEMYNNRYAREQNSLDILYRSTRILITRPCLCRLDRRIPNQSKSSDDFNGKMATECVNTAKAVADLLPDDPNTQLVMLYRAGPWWKMVHVIMQALLILLLEVTKSPSNFPEDHQDIHPYLMKMIAWLRVMRHNNGMARRAYSIVLGLMKKVASTVNINITDLIHQDEAATAIASASASAPSPNPCPTPSSHIPPPHPSATMDPYHSLFDSRDQPGDASPLLDPATDPWQYGNWSVPGWFVTDFDDENSLMAFGADVNLGLGMEHGPGLDTDMDLGGEHGTEE